MPRLARILSPGLPPLFPTDLAAQAGHSIPVLASNGRARLILLAQIAREQYLVPAHSQLSPLEMRTLGW